MANRMSGITWSDGADHYTDLIIRKKVHVDAARCLVFFNFYNFFLHNVLVSRRHIPAH